MLRRWDEASSVATPASAAQRGVTRRELVPAEVAYLERVAASIGATDDEFADSLRPD